MTRDKRPQAKGRTAFGIDIGGSGIKGAPVDLRTGTFAAERLRIPTPQPARDPAADSMIPTPQPPLPLPPDPRGRSRSAW